jgi:hypothetical protein
MHYSKEQSTCEDNSENKMRLPFITLETNAVVETERKQHCIICKRKMSYHKDNKICLDCDNGVGRKRLK